MTPNENHKNQLRSYAKEGPNKKNVQARKMSNLWRTSFWIQLPRRQLQCMQRNTVQISKIVLRLKIHSWSIAIEPLGTFY